MQKKILIKNFTQVIGDSVKLHSSDTLVNSNSGKKLSRRAAAQKSFG
jgi:hypothetical protein